MRKPLRRQPRRATYYPSQQQVPPTAFGQERPIARPSA